MGLSDLFPGLFQKTHEVRQKLFSIIAGSLMIVAGLAWNDAFSHFFEKEHPEVLKYGKWGYAVFLSVLAIIASFFAVKK